MKHPDKIYPINFARKEGFYWVEYNGEWTVAEFWRVGDGSGWDLPGEANLHVDDSDFNEIDERMIERRL